VIVNATAAAATISTAIAAVSTVMHVASLVTSWSRRALKAGCRAEMVGIADREPTNMDGSPQTQKRTRTPSRSLLSETSGYFLYSEAAARKTAMTMIKPAASQRSSVGMLEIMASRVPVHRNESPQHVAHCQTA
jgi:hypothetical protein